MGKKYRASILQQGYILYLYVCVCVCGSRFHAMQQEGKGKKEKKAKSAGLPCSLHQRNIIHIIYESKRKCSPNDLTYSLGWKKKKKKSKGKMFRPGKVVCGRLSIGGWKRPPRTAPPPEFGDRVERERSELCACGSSAGRGPYEQQ